MTIGNSLFQALNSSLPSGPLAAGTSFSFPVTFNLNGYTIAGYGGNLTISPGVQTTAINLYTNNSVTGYAKTIPISLSAKVVSAAPVLAISPLEVDFPGIVIGSPTTTQGSDDTFVISNLGQKNMTILGYGYTPGAISKDALPNAAYTNVTFTNGNATLDINGYFTSSNLPPVGTVITGGGSITVDAVFNTLVLKPSLYLRTNVSNLLIGSWELLHFTRSLYRRRYRVYHFNGLCQSTTDCTSPAIYY